MGVGESQNGDGKSKLLAASLKSLANLSPCSCVMTPPAPAVSAGLVSAGLGVRRLRCRQASVSAGLCVLPQAWCRQAWCRAWLGVGRLGVARAWCPAGLVSAGLVSGRLGVRRLGVGGLGVGRLGGVGRGLALAGRLALHRSRWVPTWRGAEGVNTRTEGAGLLTMTGEAGSSLVGGQPTGC